jgi:hypothetical protein
MCFLRHARGFGWLDPSLRRRSRRLLDTKAASPRKWDMRGRCPSRISRSALPRGFVAAVYDCRIGDDCRIGVTPNLRSPFRPFQKNSSNSVHSVQSPPPPGSHRQPLQAPRGSAYVDLSRRSRAARRRKPKKICSIPVDFFFGLVFSVYKKSISRLKFPHSFPKYDSSSLDHSEAFFAACRLVLRAGEGISGFAVFSSRLPQPHSFLLP